VNEQLMNCYKPNISVLTCSCHKLARHVNFHVKWGSAAAQVSVEDKTKVWLLQDNQDEFVNTNYHVYGELKTNASYKQFLSSH